MKESSRRSLTDAPSSSSQDNHIFTSGATGTNAAVIRGALRAERPDLLTVVLPQSMEKQPPESQELLKQVQETGAKMIEMPDNDDLTLFEASSICNDDIISRVQQIICSRSTIASCFWRPAPRPRRTRIW